MVDSALAEFASKKAAGEDELTVEALRALPPPLREELAKRFCARLAVSYTHLRAHETSAHL
eukprot:2536958-Alexandrium_andersonii.AAC.1